MGWKTDLVYGFSEIYTSSPQNSFSYFLDVNTEIEILKATVVKVINKTYALSLLNLKLIHYCV